jgi:predicted Ser/Thr protein kinase
MTTCNACGTPWPAGAEACARCGATEKVESARTDGGRTGSPATMDAAQADELLARVKREIGRDYEVHSELGRGGMAVVYKATELELLRPVALKVLPPEFAASPAMAERFRREARTAAAFDHPNIIPIYRVGQVNGLFFIAMKFVEGRSLDDVVQAQGALPILVVMHVLRAAVRALAFAHQNNIVHRDIKGANILIDQDGRVVVADFGIARAGEDAGLTATGMLMGTPYFMSPEQCAGHRVGEQSDQYSLGIVAFQMLTGTVPFRAETIPGVMQHHFFTPVPDIRQVRTDVPAALVDIISRALSKRPGDRYATTRDMQAAIEALPFTEADRQQGELLVRDLVLGVSVPKVDAGVLPPLAETLLMTPPPIRREREQTERRQLQRSMRRRYAGIGAGVALAAVALGLTAAKMGAGRGTVAADSARVSPPVAVVPATPADADTVTPSAPDTIATATAARVEATPVPTRSAATPRDTAKPVVAALAPGRLRVRVYPSDAEIQVDGRPLGRGVVLDSIVAAGPRRLRLTAPGYVPLDMEVSIVPGETAQLGTLRLVPVESRP